jgi:hypothetical protein
MFPLLLALSALAGQDKPAPPPYVPKHKLTAKLSIEEGEGQWRFIVEGTSDLPDGVVLRARAYALDEVTDHRGGTFLDEEGLSARAGRSHHDFELRGGSFRETVYESRREPFSLPYRVKVFYLPEEQRPDVAAKVADKQSFHALHDLRRGTEKDFEREVKMAAKELSLELDLVERLYRDFKAQWLAQEKKKDLAAWKAWSPDWLKRVSAIAANNEERWSLWVAWLERQGKMRVDAFCKRFVDLHRDAEELLKGDPDMLERVQEGMQGFPAKLEEDREWLGVDVPTERDAILGHVAPYAEAVARLRAIAEKRDAAAWKSEAEPLRAKARAQLLALSSRKLIPRRGYERVASISALFLRLFDLAEKTAAGGDAPELEALWKEHDAKLRDFREYAGIQ